MSGGHDTSSLLVVVSIFLYNFRPSNTCTFDPNSDVTCNQVQNSLCQHFDSWEGHNYTSFPNLFGHTDMASAEKVIVTYQDLVTVNCSRYAAHLLCSAAYPLCYEGIGRLGPCRELCEEVRDSCAPNIMENPRLRNLTRDLNCNSLPRYGTELCVWKNDDIGCQPKSVVTTAGNVGGESTIPKSISAVADCNGYLIQLGNYSKASFGGKKHCVDPCRGVYFEDHQNQLIVICTTILSMLCFVAAVFVFVTFILNFRSVQKLEASIYYTALCYVGLGLTNLISMTIGKDMLICDTSAHNSFNESAVASEGRSSPLCLAMFSATYYFTLCSWAWWGSVTLQWFLFNMGAKSIGITLTVGFHTVSWGVPLLFVLTALGTGEIIGDPITQTCWISKNQRVPFVIAPLAVTILFCSFLVLLRFSCVLSPKYKKLRGLEDKWQGPSNSTVPSRPVLFKVNIYIVLTLVVMGILFCCYFYDYWYRRAWDSIYLRCSTEPTIQACTSLPNSTKPSLPVYLAQIAASVIMGALTIMWVLRKDMMQAWKKTFKFLCACRETSVRFSEVPTPEGGHGISPISVKLEEESDSATV